MNKINIFGIAVLAMVVVGCGSKGGKSVATVNGETITQEEFIYNLDMKPTVQVMTANGPQEARVASRLGFQVMRDLIVRRATLQLAKDEGVYPTDEDVDKELKLQTKLNQNFVTNLTKSGLTLSRIKESLRFELARLNLLTKGITVTRAEAEKYVKEHPDEFKEPATVDMSWILLTDPADKAKVDKELASGQGFAFVAIQYSKDPNVRKTNGRFPTRVMSQLPGPIKDLVDKTPENKPSAWLQATDGWAKFYIDKKTPAKPIKMTDERYVVLQRQMAQERGKAASELDKRILDKLGSSKIEVDDPTLKELWKQTYDNLMKELKATPSATNPGANATTIPGANGKN